MPNVTDHRLDAARFRFEIAAARMWQHLRKQPTLFDESRFDRPFGNERIVCKATARTKTLILDTGIRCCRIEVQQPQLLRHIDTLIVRQHLTIWGYWPALLTKYGDLPVPECVVKSDLDLSEVPIDLHIYMLREPVGNFAHIVREALCMQVHL